MLNKFERTVSRIGHLLAPSHISTRFENQSRSKVFLINEWKLLLEEDIRKSLEGE